MIAFDSGVLIAFKTRNDILHFEAASLIGDIISERYGKPFITDYVFDETVTGFNARPEILLQQLSLLFIE